MTTFDLAGVRAFAADLHEELTRCDNGEGMECATLDGLLHHYAQACRAFREEARVWGRAVFAGREEYNPDVELAWREEGEVLRRRAEWWRQDGEAAVGECYTLESLNDLKSALSDLGRLLDGWVSPRLSVAPGPRQGLLLGPEDAQRVRERLAVLPPLPTDWQPPTSALRAKYRKLRQKKES